MQTRRPLVVVALFYMLGVGLALAFAPAPMLPLACAFVFVLCLRWSGWRRLVVSLLLVAATGCLLTALWQTRRDVGSVSLKAVESGSDIEMTGVIVDDPRVADSENADLQTICFTIAPESFTASGVGYRDDAGGKIRIEWEAPVRWRAPQYGEKWSIPGRLYHGHRGPQLFADRYGPRRISDGHGNRLVKACLSARAASAGYLHVGIEDFPEHAQLLQALVLGYRQRLPAVMRDNFRATGTLHIFAISGLHVGIISLLLVCILGMLRLSRVYWVIPLAPLLIAYTVATGARASAVRACLMLITYYAAPLVKRKPDSLSSLALAALVILVVDPSQLQNVGFIYSFVVVTGIIVLYPLFRKPLMRLIQPDPLRVEPGEAQLTTRDKYARLARGAGGYIISVVSVSLAAWLASAPLTALFFGRFSAMAVPANVFVVPLAFTTVLAGCLSLVLGPVWLLFADVFNHAALVLISILVYVTGAVANLPFASIEIGRVPLWSVLLWYALIGCAVVFLKRRAAAGFRQGER